MNKSRSSTFALIALLGAVLSLLGAAAYASTLATFPINQSYGSGTDNGLNVSSTFSLTGSRRIDRVFFNQTCTNGSTVIVGTSTDLLIDGSPVLTSASTAPHSFNGQLDSPPTLAAGTHTFYLQLNGTANVSTYFAQAGGCTLHSVDLVGGDDIAFETPGPTATTTTDFTFWRFQFDYNPPADGATHRPQITVTYALNGGYPFVDQTTFLEALTGHQDNVLIQKSNPLFLPAAASGTWQAVAALNDVATTATTTLTSNLASTTITFGALPQITGETSSTLATPGYNCDSSATTTIFGISFNSALLGDFNAAICAAYQYLFIPNTAQYGDLSADVSNMYGTISSKPPFGYFAIISTAFTSFNDGTNTSTLISSTTRAALSPIFDPLSTGLQVLLIVMFALWAFHFLTSLET